MSAPSTVSVFSVPFFTGSKAEFVSRLESSADAGQKGVHIATVNPEFLVESLSNAPFAAILRNASCVADGQWIVFAERFLRHWGRRPAWLRRLAVFPSLARFALASPKDSAFAEVIPWSELVYDLVALCERKGWTVALVGAAEGVAAAAAEKLNSKYPGVRIAYASSGFAKYDERGGCVAELSKVAPDAVLVALGSPKQERFIAEDLLPALPNAKFAIGLGGTFDFVAGRIPRAPEFFRKAKLEWFFRLLKEPKVRYRRILRAVVTFPWEVAKRGS